jgi:spore coat protein CotF
MAAKAFDTILNRERSIQDQIFSGGASKTFENVLELERRAQRPVLQAFDNTLKREISNQGQIFSGGASQTFENVLELERRAQRPVLQAFNNIVKFTSRTQGQAGVFYKNEIAPRLKTYGPPPQSPPQSTPPDAPLVPVDVNGFYTVTGPKEVTFYATTNTPREGMGAGWVVSGVTGIKGQLQTTGADLNLNMEPRVKKFSDQFSESYVWSFTLQSDTDQSLPPYQYTTGTILYPPGQISYTALKRTAPIYGSYTVNQNVITFVFSAPPLDGFGPGWTVVNLPGISSNTKVISYTDLYDQDIFNFGNAKIGVFANKVQAISTAGRLIQGDVIFTIDDEAIDSINNLNTKLKLAGEGSDITIKIKRGNEIISVTDTITKTTDIKSFAILAPIDGSIPENTYTPVFVNGLPAMMQEPKFTSEFVAGTFVQQTSEEESIKKINIDINPLVIGGEAPELRDLNTGLKCLPPQLGPYEDVKGRGFSTGSLLGLFAIGPQENYILTQDFSKSQWNPSFKRYTNSVMYQRVIPFPPANPSYQDKTIQLELRPTELGHLLSNMYLKVTMPALAAGYQYSPQLGRALIKQVDLLVNETVIETLYDDWYIVRDQLFLDADEQTGMFKAVGGSNINSQVSTDYIIPLDFFFCRRKSHADSGNERLRRPYFPICAMWNQKLYVRFTFHPNTWWCNVAAPHTTDLILPKLVTEEILLENSEKLYYMNTPLKYIVNRVKKESTLTFSAGNPQLQLTASFPVQTLVWFFRNKNYEDTTSGDYSDSRYNYGYTTNYIKTGIQLQFPSGNANYVDVIDTAKITLNNVDILSTFQGSLYYSFKQPLEHGLSIPSKSIYTYSFGLTPKEYNQGGYLNFSKLNSHTTSLSLVFNPSYASQITQGYNLYMFYYGYTLLEFQGGYARLPFV